MLGKWHAPDPLSQFHSPYLANFNNPANFVDPDGRSADIGAAIRMGFSMSGFDFEAAISLVIEGIQTGSQFKGFEVALGVGGTLVGCLSVGLTIKDCIDGQASIMEASMKEVVQSTSAEAGRAQSTSTDTKENVNSTPVLRMYLKEVDGEWDDDYIVWKATFSIIIGDLEYEIKHEDLEEVYFGMMRQFWLRKGNFKQNEIPIPVHYEGLNSHKEDPGWNIGVLRIDNSEQFFHRGRNLDDSAGCFIASCYPYLVEETLTPKNGSPYVVKTYNSSGTDLYTSTQSHQILKDIMLVYNSILLQNPNLKFEVYFGADAKTNKEMDEFLKTIQMISQILN